MSHYYIHVSPLSEALLRCNGLTSLLNKQIIFPRASSIYDAPPFSSSSGKTNIFPLPRVGFFSFTARVRAPDPSPSSSNPRACARAMMASNRVPAKHSANSAPPTTKPATSFAGGSAFARTRVRASERARGVHTRRALDILASTAPDVDVPAARACARVIAPACDMPRCARASSTQCHARDDRRSREAPSRRVTMSRCAFFSNKTIFLAAHAALPDAPSLARIHRARTRARTHEHTVCITPYAR